MRKLNKREQVMLGLLAVVLLGMLYFGQGGSGFGGAPAGVENKGGGGKAGDAPVVMLASINSDSTSYREDGRDLFKYGKRPPSQAELDAARRKKKQAQQDLEAKNAALKEKQKRDQEIAKARKREVPKPKGPVLPTASFKYIGHLGPLESRIAVFEAGDELVLAKAGDTIQQDFVLKEFGFEKVVLGFTDEEFADKTTELDLDRAASKRASGAGGSGGKRPKSRRSRR
ncbi:hypothetical protein ABI59_02075 [Acidobacteria bacterium Mor1]|nr:hypothetical protein ABI59_02075 [Acidobacteria bacterium Mor1]